MDCLNWFCPSCRILPEVKIKKSGNEQCNIAIFYDYIVLEDPIRNI